MQDLKAGKYRQLQALCIVSSLANAIAVLLAIYMIRIGHFDQFSVVRLMHFVPHHIVLWRLSWLSLGTASITFLLFVLSLEDIISRIPRIWMRATLIVALLAVAVDIPSQSRMLVLFADVSAQLVYGGTFAKKVLLIEGWKAINQCLTESIMVANSLYSVAGLGLSAMIINGKGLPRWLGWTSVPIWLAGLAATIFTFQGNVLWGLILLLSSLIGIIAWGVLVAVSVDSLARSDEEVESA